PFGNWYTELHAAPLWHVCERNDKIPALGSGIASVALPAPGAATSTRPTFEKAALVSLGVVADTTITSGIFCGDKLRTSIDSFPAAITTTIPALCATRTASSMAGTEGQWRLHVDQLLLMTSAPFCAA